MSMLSWWNINIIIALTSFSKRILHHFITTNNNYWLFERKWRDDGPISNIIILTIIRSSIMMTRDSLSSSPVIEAIRNSWWRDRQTIDTLINFVCPTNAVRKTMKAFHPLDIEGLETFTTFIGNNGINKHLLANLCFWPNHQNRKKVFFALC